VTKPNFCVLNSDLLSILLCHLRISYNANIIYLTDITISITSCKKTYYKVYETVIKSGQNFSYAGKRI
jgi:hypothetical protein